MILNLIRIKGSLNLILKTQKSILFISAAFFIVFSAAEAYGMRIIDISERVKFCFSRPDPRFDRLQGFLKAADSVTYSISGLKASDKTALCSVIISGNEMKDGFEINTSGNVLRIFLSDDLSGWEGNFKAHSAVISAMLLSRFGISPDSNYGKVPHWMNAGIISKIEMRRNPSMLSGVTGYPGMRGLATGGLRPDLWCMINNPLEYGDGPSFTLYSEICAITIDSISRIPKNREVFLSILKSAVNGEKADTAFKTTINDYIMKSGFDFSTLPTDRLSPEKRVGLWFETSARNSSVNIFFPGSSDFVEKRLEELKTLDYTAVAAAGKEQTSKPEIKTCEMYELGIKWNEIENPERITNIYGRYFSDLSNQSPSQIKNEVIKIVELFSRLKDNDKGAFERELREAERKLREKIAIQRQLEDYLRECEKRFTPFGKRYSAELKYIEETGTFTGLFSPTLNSILDKEEKSF